MDDAVFFDDVSFAAQRPPDAAGTGAFVTADATVICPRHLVAGRIGTFTDDGVQDDRIDRRSPAATTWLGRPRVGRAILRHPSLQRPIPDAEQGREFVVSAFTRF